MDSSLLLRGLKHEVDRLGSDDAFAFLYGDELVGMNVGDGVFMTARPKNLKADQLVGVGLAESEGQRQLALR